MDMVAYIMMALAVALLAGFTGAMPVPELRRRHPGSAARPDRDGQPASSADMARGLSRAADQGAGVLASTRGRALEEIVDSLMQGTQFVALTGSPGAGKTVMATAIHQELCTRSVSVRWVDGRGGSSIPLRVIISRVLGKPETDVGADDIEELFDAMTEREAAHGRLALIIDDAERLLPDAVGYLRLLASVAMDRMPQIVFVGDPSFWDVAAKAAGFEKLITARFELASPSAAVIHNQGAAERLVRPSDGLVGRRGSLIAALRASGAIGLRAALDLARNNLHWGRSVAGMAGVAAMVIGVTAMPAYKLATVGVARVSPVEQPIPLGKPLATDSASMVVIRLPPATQAPSGISEPGSSTQLITASAVAPDLFEPRSFPSRQIGYGGTDLHRPAKVKTAQKQLPFTGYTTGSTNGTWLFPANVNSGANS
jgi:hypothetical protein